MIPCSRSRRACIRLAQLPAWTRSGGGPANDSHRAGGGDGALWLPHGRRYHVGARGVSAGKRLIRSLSTVNPVNTLAMRAGSEKAGRTEKRTKSGTVQPQSEFELFRRRLMRPGRTGLRTPRAAASGACYRPAPHRTRATKYAVRAKEWRRHVIITRDARRESGRPYTALQ